MKTTIRKTFRLLEVLCVLAIALLLSMFTAQESKAQTALGNDLFVITNFPAVINPMSVSNTSIRIKVYNGSGLALAWSTASSAGNSNDVMFLNPSVDGTNKSTETWRWNRPASNGTNVLVSTTNWSADTLRGYDSIFISGATNGHGTGITTNRGLFYRRPSVN